MYKFPLYMGLMKKKCSFSAYRIFISSLPCDVCGTREGVCPHHEPLGRAGKSLKAPDTHCIPLCVAHHLKRHQVGVHTFWGNTDLAMKCLDYLTLYFQEA